MSDDPAPTGGSRWEPAVADRSAAVEEPAPWTCVGSPDDGGSA